MDENNLKEASGAVNDELGYSHGILTGEEVTHAIREIGYKVVDEDASGFELVVEPMARSQLNCRAGWV